jgi:hypothetical protein
MIDWQGLTDLGFNVIALPPRSKGPPVVEWAKYQKERVPADDIKRWARNRNSNAAIVCGAVSGVFVLDIDSSEAMEEVRRRGLPPTLTVQTLKGCHYYFRHPGFKIGNKVSILGGKIDVRGDGGYAVAPGSIHEDDHSFVYTIDDSSPVHEAPEWLLDELRPKAKPPVPKSNGVHVNDKYVQAALDGLHEELANASEGERNNTLFKKGARLFEFVAAGAVPESVVRSELLAMAIAIGLDERSASKTIDSASKHGLQQPAQIPDRKNVNPTREQRSVEADSAGADPLPVERSTEISFNRSDYLVKSIIEPGDFSVLFGPSGGGKTFKALDIGHGIATGRERVLGRRVKQAPVLLCALEGARGLAKRVEAINRELGPAPDLFVYRKSLVLFQNEALERRLVATVQNIGARLVIIDTLSRTMAGGDENGPADMTAMISVFGRIATDTGAHVMVVHHTGKDESRGSRGHNSLKGAADVEIEVTGDAGEHIVRLAKVKDGADGERIAFRLRVVQLGVDDEGDDITTCVVEECGKRQALTKSVKLSKGDLQALGWLREAVDEYGEAPPIDLPFGTRVTAMTKWIEVGRKRSGEGDAVRKAVKRAVTNLTVAKMIGIHDPYVWLTRLEVVK